MSLIRTIDDCDSSAVYDTCELPDAHPWGTLEGCMGEVGKISDSEVMSLVLESSLVRA